MPPGRDADEHIDSARRRDILAATGALGTTLLAGCRGTPTDDGMRRRNGDGSNADWLSTELSTVRESEAFTVDGLAAPVVVHPFAVWSSDAGRQSTNLGELGDALTVVSLNTDASEGDATVAEYATENGFDWRFAVASTELTNALISAFGPSVAKPRNTPIIVVCGDGSTAYRSGSVRTAAEIEAIASDC